MHDQLKKRLVGGAVLVALAVIFLPMLLEEESPLDEGFSEQPIPPSDLGQQGFRSQTLPLPGGDGGNLPPVEPLIEPPPVFIPPRQPEVAEPSVKPLVEPEGITPIKPVSQPKPVQRPQPKPVEKVAAKPAAKPKPVSKPRKASPDGNWVVQVASVTNQVRAEQLAVKLRAKDYPAFVESADVDGRTWYRVRVGPQKDRGYMDTLLTRLRSDPLVSGMDPKVISNK
jgi:DedD protein